MPTSTPRASRLRLSRSRLPRGAYMEALEARLLMIATYSLVFDSFVLPGHSVANIVTKGSAKVTLTNLFNDPPGAGDKGEIHIVARPVGAADATTDIELGKMLNQAIGFAVNGKKSYTIALTVPANTPLGDYDVLAIADRTVPVASTLATAVASHGFSEDAQKLDLRTTLGVVTLPAGGLISGGATMVTVPVVLTNDGNITTPVGEKVSIAFFARPVGGGADVPLTAVAPITNKALAGVKPGATKSFSAKVLFPVTVGAGAFEIVATATATGPTAEEVPENNSAVTSGSVQVTQGFLDFGTTLVSVKGPVAIVAGTPASGSVQAKVTNLGNIKTSAFDSVSVTLVARPEGGGADILLKSLPNQKVASLKEGTGFKNFTLPYTLAAGTPAGVYHLVVTTTPDGPGVDINPVNDVLTLPETVTVAPSFVDLSVFSATTTLGATVAGEAGGVANVIVKNVGNVPSTGYLVEVFATTDGIIHDGAVPVGSATSATAKIASGGTLKVPVTVQMPAPVAQTDYILVARTTLAADGNAGNDTGNVATVTVTATPALLGNAPTSYSFTEDAVDNLFIQITKRGNATALNGDLAVHRYDYTYYTAGLTKQVQMTVGWLGGVHVTLTFPGVRPTTLAGKVMTFQRSSAGATGTFVAEIQPAAGINVRTTGFFKIT